MIDSRIEKLASVLVNYSVELKKGEVYEEFYLDDEALQKMLIETFYILKK
jgi:hypothetical protein